MLLAQKNYYENLINESLRFYDKSNFNKGARVRSAIGQKDYIVNFDLIANQAQTLYFVSDAKALFIINSIGTDYKLEPGQIQNPIISIRDGQTEINFSSGPSDQENKTFQSAQNFGPAADALNFGGPDLKILSEQKNLFYCIGSQTAVSISAQSTENQKLSVIVTGYQIYLTELEAA